MFETLINYGIFFVGIILLAFLAVIIRKSAMLSGIFKIAGSSILFLLRGVMHVLFIVINSMAAGIVILVHPFFFGKAQFFSGEEPVYLLSLHDEALLLFSLTYGVLYVLLFFITSILKGTSIESLFTFISRKLLFIFRYRGRKFEYEERISVVSRHLMASSVVFLLYPFIVPFLFSDLKVTLLGNLTLFICLLLFSITPGPRYRDRVGRNYDIYENMK